MTPRPPRADGQGDQRRAHEIATALASEWDIEVVSWLPDIDQAGARRWACGPAQLARVAKLAFRAPLQVAYFQAAVPDAVRRRVAAGGHDCVIFVTNRAVMPSNGAATVIDFVDDIGATAFRRAGSARPPLSLFWQWEARRLRRFDRHLAEAASVTVAHSQADATGIAPGVDVVPLAIATQPLPDDGDKVTFLGNLFYAPNHEAGLWICQELVSALIRRGVNPRRVIIAGRRPRPALVDAATQAGVDFRPGFDDQVDILRETAVALAPMTQGSGSQCKVVDAIGARRACIVTPRANAGLDLVDEESALVRTRQAEPFAEAIVRLLDDRDLRRRLAGRARAHVAGYTSEAVGAQWRAVVSTTVPTDSSA